MPQNEQTARELSPDQIHQLLSVRRRRYVLYYLYKYANPIRLPDLAEYVTEKTQEEPPHSDDHSQIYLSLYHCDIPKLAEDAVVSYFQEEDMVELGANAAQLRPYLEQTAESDLSIPDNLRL